jgi:hypothetical protein
MIIRSEKKDRFTIISNELLNDNRITDKALGTLVRLLSKPDNWNLNINHLVKTGKQGRTAIRSSIAELEKTLMEQNKKLETQIRKLKKRHSMESPRNIEDVIIPVCNIWSLAKHLGEGRPGRPAGSGWQHHPYG